MNVPEMALAAYYILKAGGLGSGGYNFDAKIRRQSLDPDDLLIAHVGSMDACARGLLIAEQIIKDGVFDGFVADRYAGWKSKEGRAILTGKRSLDDMAAYVHKKDLEPQPVSGKQEYLESLINSSAPAGTLKKELRATLGHFRRGDDCRRRRRQCRLGLWYWRHPSGRGLRVARHLGRAFRLQREIPAQYRGRGPCLLPRHSRHLAPVGVILAAADALNWLAKTVTASGSRCPRRPRPSSRGRPRKSSCPILAASAPRTIRRRRRGRSPD